MKNKFTQSILVAGAMLAGFTATAVFAADPQPGGFFTTGGGGSSTVDTPRMIVRAHSPADGNSAGKEHTWLGVGVEETTEALTAQLDLKPGQGLVVDYVPTNSPAALAGLKVNDVLAELDGQMLVDPMQLRKLADMHADGTVFNDAVVWGFAEDGASDVVLAQILSLAEESSFGQVAQQFSEPR